jgi:hypothetical protein
MVENVESFCAEQSADGLGTERNGFADEGIDRIDGRAAARIAADNDAIDDGAVGSGAGVAAVRDASDEVVRQTAGEGGDAADGESERRGVDTAEDDAIALSKMALPSSYWRPVSRGSLGFWLVVSGSTVSRVCDQT